MDDGFTAPRDRRIGVTVQGRYRILRRIGEGGMGAVYEAEHLLIKKRVAIKTLHAHLSARESSVARFRREALAASAVQNEHVVEVTDMGQFEDDGALFIVLEYLDGRNLADEIEASGPMPLGRVMRIACQVCDALEAVHARGVVHRDLKPENLFLVKRSDNSDFVKVLDFGISKLRHSVDDGPTRLTDDGTILGTAHFMSPEQAHGDPNTDHRTDLYALGGILYHMLTGSLPFEAETIPALFMKVIYEPPPPISSRRTDLPPEVTNAVERCLQKRAADRFGSAAELKQALWPYRDVGDKASVHPTPSSWVPPAGGSIPSISQLPMRRHAWLPWALGVLGVLLAIGIALLTHHTKTPAAEALAPAIEATQRPPAASKRPAAALVRVHIATEPSDAQLWLDGQSVPNPFNHERGASDEVHVVEARAEGFRPARNSLRFNTDTNLRIELEKLEAAEEPRAPIKRVVAPVAVPPRTPVLPAAAPPAPASAAPEPESEKPATADDVLGKRQLKRIGI
jgi:serine/threonine protein kinase